MENDIIINGIETNNLKNINIIIKKNALNLIIGSSGSGKSSLAYDTIAQIGLHEYMSMFNDDIYKKLEQYKNEIDNKINGLEWEYLEDRKVNRISCSNNSKDNDSSYVWLLDMVDRFKEVFLEYLYK